MPRLGSIMVVALSLFGGLGMHCQRPEEKSVPAGAYAAVATAPEVVCGDALVMPPEPCDDGNLSPGDGCDRCALEAPLCAPGIDGVVWSWSCDGAPSRCSLDACRSTGADADCPPELATRAVTAAVKLEGFIDPDRVDSPRVEGAGLSCTCTESFEGRICDPGCTAAVATCAPSTLATSAATSRFSRWGWACSGTSPGCVLRPEADAFVEAWHEAAPVQLAGVAAFDVYAGHVSVLAIDGPDGDALIAGATTMPGVTIGRHRVGADDDWGQQTFVAQVGRDGTIRHVLDLGSQSAVRVQAGAFTSDGYWLVTTEGEHDGHDVSPDRYPRYAVARVDRRGKQVARRALDILAAQTAELAPTDRGVAVVLSPMKRERHEGDVYWASSSQVILGLDRRARERWRLAGAGSETVHALRVSGDTITLAGRAAVADTAVFGSAIAAAPRTDRPYGEDYRPFRMRMTTRGKVRDVEALAAQQYFTAALGPGDDLVTMFSPSGLATQLTRTGTDGWSRQRGLPDSAGGYADATTLLTSADGSLLAWVEREYDETRDWQRAHQTIPVIDADGQLLHQWRLPVRAPAQVGARLGGIQADGTVVVALDITGPYRLGAIRVPRDQSRSFIAWLTPRTPAPLAD